MLQFKQIELSDKSLIDKFLDQNTFRACDFCFTNMFAWNAKFKTQYSVLGKTLFLRFLDADGAWTYLMPIGEMDLKDAFRVLQEDAKYYNMSFRMRAVTADMWENIEKIFPGEFEYLYERHNDEYIYLSEKLIFLSGKKLQSKRNHINRFKADYPHWEYIRIEGKEMLTACIEMLGKWDDLHDDVDKSLSYDYIATKLMLEHFDELRLKGGLIKVGGKIVAFSVGEKLTNDTFVVHVEKAFGEINGAYTIINQQFVLNEASSFKYINREEDMGIESLRKAKMSYKPDILLQEGLVIPITSHNL